MTASKTIIWFIFAVVAISITIGNVSALNCPCQSDLDNVHLYCQNDVNCSHGFTKDHCGCCDVCAKAPGENCGGPWFIVGRCSEGYHCVTKQSNINAIGKCEERGKNTS